MVTSKIFPGESKEIIATKKSLLRSSIYVGYDIGLPYKCYIIKISARLNFERPGLILRVYHYSDLFSLHQ